MKRIKKKKDIHASEHVEGYQENVALKLSSAPLSVSANQSSISSNHFDNTHAQNGQLGLRVKIQI